jgi:hypothetical protein
VACRASPKPDDGAQSAPKPKADKGPPEPKADKSELCRYLWDKSEPAIGSPVQTYLESRQCWHLSSRIRYLRGGEKYAHAMISRFGFDEPVQSVHLTKLAPDGRGKLQGEHSAKIIMGESMGLPIIVHENDEHDACLIAEGIEDVASLVLASGWTGWAAGTANRIPAVVATAVEKGFTAIYVAKDADTYKRAGQDEHGRPVKPASWLALDKANAVHPVIPLSFVQWGGVDERLDANLFLRRHGKEQLFAAIQWCEIQDRWTRDNHERMKTGRLPNNHKFQRELDPLRAILPSMT